MKGKQMSVKKLNNRGVAMISIMIAVAFITVIASALLYITYSNYSMKTMNLRSKENFYEIDGQVNIISAKTRNILNGTTSDDPASNITKLTAGGAMPTVDTPVQYDVRNFCYMADPMASHLYGDRVGNFTAASDADDYKYYYYLKGEGYAIGGLERAADDEIRLSSEKGDSFEYYTEYGAGTNGMVTVEEDSTTGATKYTFHNLCIEEKAGGGYVNRIKTDIEITTVKRTGTGEEGGIGEFSMLSDSSLKVDGGGFTVMDIYGNCYFSSTDGTGSYTKADGTDATFTKPGTEALVLNDESKVNIIGQYLVVYGDIVLNGNSCLYLGNGNLTVYGDIILNGNSTLICNGKIYMVDGELPGRGQSEIKIASGTTKEQHIYPASTTVSKLSKAQFEEFCHTLCFDDANTANDGITKQILKSVTLSGGDFDPATFSGNINGNPKGTLTKFYGQDIAVGFNTQDTINGDFKNRVVFNLKDGATIRESNPGTTVISCKPVKVDQKHSVSVTKIGDDVFEWLISCKKTDTSDSRFDAAVHNFQLQTDSKGSGYISTADLFQPDCNPKVKKMLRQATGGGSGSDSYYSSIRLVNYVKDYE